MSTVNSELLRLARDRFNKSAAVMSPQVAGAGAPSPAMDPAMAAAAGAPPMDPSMDPAMAAAAAGAAPAMDPAMAATPMPPMPPAQQAAPAQQKLKPEQMMQMIDYRLYNMQQQLTAIMNTLGVQLPPEAIVLPPGSTSAPAPETALPGGAGAPATTPPADPAAAAGGAPAGGVYNGMDPEQTGGAVPPIPPVKAARWWDAEQVKSVSYIGEPVPRNDADVNTQQPANLQVAASAASALFKSLITHAR
jgi:hypothetical protein